MLISMKLVLLLLFVSIQQVYALDAQQTVSLKFEKVSLKIIFKEINRQTGYEFIYNTQMIEKSNPVTVNLEKSSLTAALDVCFKGQPFSYVIKGNTIVVTPKNQNKPKITITGKITDSQGEPLAGTNITIKGTVKGKVSDENGTYSIETEDKSVLVFRFIGYKTREIPVSGKTTINVVLQEDAAELKELEFVSTGYQKIRPEQSTGSIATIRAREFESRVNTTDFLIGLQNKIPGLLINNDIEFEGNSLFQIRGISTINGSKQPLIVLDGYPTELTMDMIDPNEIESVTVLKDAAAATIYGVRASNGVVVVERKKADVGKTKINFRSTLSFTPKENYSRYRWDENGSQISVDYSKANYASINSSMWTLMTMLSVGSLFYYTPQVNILAKQAAGVITSEEAERQFQEMYSYTNTKDYSKLFLRTATTQTYNMDISGGNSNVLYYITANFVDNDANQIRKGNNKFQLSSRNTFNISKRFTANLMTDFQEATTKESPVPSITSIYPFEKFQDENGNPLSIYSGSNMNPVYNDMIMNLGLLDNMYYPLVDLYEINNTSTTISNRITLNLNYKINNDFNLSFGGVYENSDANTRHYASENSSEVHQYVNRYTQSGTTGLVYNVPKGGYLKTFTKSTESSTLRAQLNYDKRFNDSHSLNMIVGGEIRKIVNKSNSAGYFGYSDQTLLQNPVNYAIVSSASFVSPYGRLNPSIAYNSLFAQTYTDNRYISGYLNAVYAYLGKYTVTGSIRIDQSNLFGTNPKYKYKPLWSIGAGWNINKEKFMQNLTWVRSLKLRSAVGFNGNTAKNVLPEVIASASQSVFDSSIPSLTLLSLANSQLRWEKTLNVNVGLDFNLMDDITGSLDYYNKKSTDILANNQIDPTKGATSATINRSTIRNTGLELNLHADWITKKRFNWNTGFVLSHNKSKILEVYNSSIPSNAGSYLYALGGRSTYLEGYGIGAIFTYRYAGLDETGAVLIYDKDGNKKHFDEDDKKKDDVDYQGTSIPAYNVGISNRVDIGDFYFYAMINYYGGFKVKIPVPDASVVRPLKGAGKYWTKAGDEADPDMLPALKYSNYKSYFQACDKFVVDGDYFTLGDVNATYSLRNSKWLKKTKLTNLEIRMQASNLYTIALNKQNYSMATRSYDKSYLTPTYTISFNVTF
jgi:TonB-linked SusC/RagA family outer membrane protein